MFAWFLDLLKVADATIRKNRPQTSRKEASLTGKTVEFVLSEEFEKIAVLAGYSAAKAHSLGSGSLFSGNPVLIKDRLLQVIEKH